MVECEIDLVRIQLFLYSLLQDREETKSPLKMLFKVPTFSMIFFFFILQCNGGIFTFYSKLFYHPHGMIVVSLHFALARVTLNNRPQPDKQLSQHTDSFLGPYIALFLQPGCWELVKKVLKRRGGKVKKKGSDERHYEGLKRSGERQSESEMEKF